MYRVRGIIIIYDSNSMTTNKISRKYTRFKSKEIKSIAQGRVRIKVNFAKTSERFVRLLRSACTRGGERDKVAPIKSTTSAKCKVVISLASRKRR